MLWLASLLFPCRLTINRWLSSQSCWVSGSHPAGRPAFHSSRPKAPELYAFWLRCLPVVGFLLIGSSAESLGRLVLAMPRGSAAHRFVWAAGWHAVLRVLIWCQLFSIFPYPPSYFVPQLVYTHHPPTEIKKIRESLCWSESVCPAWLVSEGELAADWWMYEVSWAELLPRQ